MRISDWSSDVCSSDLRSVVEPRHLVHGRKHQQAAGQGDENMGSKAGGARAIFALGADDRAGDACSRDRPEKRRFEKVHAFPTAWQVRWFPGEQTVPTPGDRAAP